MIKINFTETDIEQYRKERYHHPHPRVLRFITALLLKSQNLPHQKISDFWVLCPTTMRSYH